ALAHCSEDQEIADGLWDADAGRDRGRMFPAFSKLIAILERADHWRAAFGLDGVHARALGSDEANRLHLVERLPHADEAGAPAGRIEDRVGQFPAELLGEFQAHRLLALDPVRLLERR